MNLMPWRMFSADTVRASLTLTCLTALTACHLWLHDIPGVTLRGLLADVATVSPNSIDADRAFQNYYGELLESGPREVSGAPSIPSTHPPRLDAIQFSGATRPTDNHLRWELIPNVKVVFKGVLLEVNEWGQRDRTGYTLSKPEDTFRVCIVGGSNSMGYGVPEEQTFANLIELRLNRELTEHGYQSYEVINFSVGGYQLHERLYVVQNKVGAFDPDLILVDATERDLTTQYLRLAGMIHAGEPIQFRFLRQIIRDADCDSRTDSLERLERKLQPFAEEILLGSLRELSEYARRNQVETALFLLRRTGGEQLGKDLVRTLELLRQGEQTVFSVFKAYEGVRPMELWLHPSLHADQADAHPSVEGHRRIADDLFGQLLADPTTGPLLRNE